MAIQGRSSGRQQDVAFGRIADDLERAAFSMGSLLAGINEVKNVVDGFRILERELITTNSVANGTREQFIAMEKSVRSFSLASRFAASEAANALYFLASAGYSVDESMRAMSSVLNLAQATMTDINQSADLMASTLRAFKLEADDASRVANVLASATAKSQASIDKLSFALRQVGPVAGDAGVSIEDTTAALSSLFDVGLQGEQAGTVLRNVLVSLQAPTGDAKDLLKQLGIATRDTSGEFRNLYDVLSDLANKNLSSGDIARLFGTEAASGASALFSAIKTKSIYELRDAISGTSDATRIATDMLDSLDGSIRIARNAYEDMRIEVGEQLAPTLREMLDTFVEIEIAFHDADAPTKDLIVNLGLMTAGAYAFYRAQKLIFGGEMLANIRNLKVAIGEAAIAMRLLREASAIGALGTQAGASLGLAAGAAGALATSAGAAAIALAGAGGIAWAFWEMRQSYSRARISEVLGEPVKLADNLEASFRRLYRTIEAGRTGRSSGITVDALGELSGELDKYREAVNKYKEDIDNAQTELKAARDSIRLMSLFSTDDTNALNLLDKTDFMAVWNDYWASKAGEAAKKGGKTIASMKEYFQKELRDPANEWNNSRKEIAKEIVDLIGSSDPLVQNILQKGFEAAAVPDTDVPLFGNRWKLFGDALKDQAGKLGILVDDTRQLQKRYEDAEVDVNKLTAKRDAFFESLASPEQMASLSASIADDMDRVFKNSDINLNAVRTELSKQNSQINKVIADYIEEIRKGEGEFNKGELYDRLIKEAGKEGLIDADRLRKAQEYRFSVFLDKNAQDVRNLIRSQTVAVAKQAADLQRDPELARLAAAMEANVTSLTQFDAASEKIDKMMRTALGTMGDKLDPFIDLLSGKGEMEELNRRLDEKGKLTVADYQEVFKKNGLTADQFVYNMVLAFSAETGIPIDDLVNDTKLNIVKRLQTVFDVRNLIFQSAVQNLKGADQQNFRKFDFTDRIQDLMDETGKSMEIAIRRAKLSINPGDLSSALSLDLDQLFLDTEKSIREHNKRVDDLLAQGAKFDGEKSKRDFAEGTRQLRAAQVEALKYNNKIALENMKADNENFIIQMQTQMRDVSGAMKSISGDVNGFIDFQVARQAVDVEQTYRQKVIDTTRAFDERIRASERGSEDERKIIELKKQTLDLLAQEYQQNLDVAASEENRARVSRDAANQWIDNYEKMHELTGTFWEGVDTASDRATVNQITNFQLGQQAYEQYINGMSDLFSDLIVGTDQGWSDMLGSMLRQWARFAAQIASSQIFNSILGWIGGAASAGTGSFVEAGAVTAPTVAAQGRVFIDGNPQRFAKGGTKGNIVYTPTRFPTNGGQGLMGEERPEAVMPLTRTPDGELGVRVTNGGGGDMRITYAPVYELVFQGAGGPGGGNFDPSAAQDMLKGLDSTIQMYMTKFVQKEQMPGGLIWRALNGR